MPTQTKTLRANGDQRRGAGTLTVAAPGASGRAGAALLHRLVDSRRVGRVLVLGRHQTACRPAGIESSSTSVGARGRGGVVYADAVVHIAFALYGVTPEKCQLLAINVEGTLSVARGRARGRRALVYISSAAGHPAVSGRPGAAAESGRVKVATRFRAGFAG
jgi:nucleoside-diphosphate-sugar epimerase